ncbi:hypothetical protein KCP75_13620 [Salmonella enterica subsp. enterica]|nr:hypothetical protein KCP75_13620 [Salmonella enterica subsp. enterica]
MVTYPLDKQTREFDLAVLAPDGTLRIHEQHVLDVAGVASLPRWRRVLLSCGKGAIEHGRKAGT